MQGGQRLLLPCCTVRMGDGDVQDQAHPMGDEPLREVDVAHLPAGGAMLRHLRPSMPGWAALHSPSGT
eukprot:767345-Hanusia_phi.AAC.3